MKIAKIAEMAKKAGFLAAAFFALFASAPSFAQGAAVEKPPKIHHLGAHDGGNCYTLAYFCHDEGEVDFLVGSADWKKGRQTAIPKGEEMDREEALAADLLERSGGGWACFRTIYDGAGQMWSIFCRTKKTKELVVFFW